MARANRYIAGSSDWTRQARCCSEPRYCCHVLALFLRPKRRRGGPSLDLNNTPPYDQTLRRATRSIKMDGELVDLTRPTRLR